MKCQKCGSHIPDGELFCRSCGAEVQLVPDYHSADYLLQYKDRLQKEKEQAIREQLALEEKRKKRRRRIKIAGISLTCVAVALAVGIGGYIYYHNLHSPQYQYNRAQKAYTSGDMEKADDAIQRALSLDGHSGEAWFLYGDILTETDQTAQAIDAYKHVISLDANNAQAYGKLIALYEQQQDTESIHFLMNDCQNQEILDQYQEYISPDPVFETAEGEYKYKTRVTISGEGTIYYTVDGAIPTADSTEYTQPFQLEEGTTVVQAIAINEKGISSNMVSRKFTVVLVRPNPPTIAPDTGTYPVGTTITVSVPAGCTAYYTFDATPTKDSTPYTGPVEMPEGNHIFSVILIDENQKQSYAASETYVVDEAHIEN